MPKCGYDPRLIREMINCSFEVLAGGTIEELWNCLFHAIGEPSTRRLLFRRGTQLWKLFGKRLRAHDSTIEMSGYSVFFCMRNLYINLFSIGIVEAEVAW